MRLKLKTFAAAAPTLFFLLPSLNLPQITASATFLEMSSLTEIQ